MTQTATILMTGPDGTSPDLFDSTKSVAGTVVDMLNSGWRVVKVYNRVTYLRLDDGTTAQVGIYRIGPR